MFDPDSVESIETRLRNLRSSISDLGYEVDSYKTKTAAALGVGVFLLLLAVGAAYDLVSGKGGVWLTIGVTRDSLVWISSGFGVIAIVLVAYAFIHVIRRDRGLDSRLEQMEQEYAELIELKDARAGHE
ncbi:MAG: hypothetical protein WAV47_11630 [Blastocatellia bacterium]